MSWSRYIKRYTGCLALLYGSICNSAAQQALPALIPMPRHLTMTDGRFLFTTNTVIRTEDTTSPALAYFVKQLGHPHKMITGKAPAKQTEVLITSAGTAQLPEEGYRLTVTPARITLAGKGAGLFYGLQTLLQLINTAASDGGINAMAIEDAPRFGYRGLMLDVSRHFFTIAAIKELLDLMAYYKLNRFHWHLTDDQGWRLEIKSYPKLTTVGAWRVPRIEFSGNTLPPQPGEVATDGGYYTQEQVRDIINYAAARHIEILPEIDVPGHSMAAIAAYPELCVTKDTSIKVSPGSSFAKWFPNGGFEMYADNSLDPVDERVYTFLEKVIGEVAALFPYPYIHIGGDECYKAFWEREPRVQAFIKSHQLKDAHALQTYFIGRLNNIILSKHKQMIAWDEVAAGEMNDSITIMNRFGEKPAAEQIRKGMHIILAPGGNGLYFDYAQSSSDQEPSSHGGDAPVMKAYEYNPDYDGLAPGERKFIMGVEACVWTENIPTVAKLQYMLLPRMLALAETAWTDTTAKDYTRFASHTLPVHLAAFDKAGLHYRVPTAFNYTDTTFRTDKFRFEALQPQAGARIYYTLNNRPPGDYDHVYTKPVEIIVPKGKTITLKTIVITPAGRRSIVTRTVLDNSTAADK